MSADERDGGSRRTGLLDSLKAAVNGVVGEGLARRWPALAGEMSCSSRGHVLDLDGGGELLPDATAHICVLVHALMTHEGSWKFEADGGTTDYGRLLEHDLGLTPVYVRYNTGRAIAANGAELDALLDRLLARWPVPVESVALVGHSMGGLVLRAAFRARGGMRREARRSAGLPAWRIGRGWRARTSHVVLLGAPNAGAWGSRLSGSLADWLVTFGLPIAVAAAFTGSSEGMRELRHGIVEEPSGGRRLLRRRRRELPRQTQLLLVAGSVRGPDHLLSRFVGDGLVGSKSALGDAGSERRRVTFRDAEVRTVPNHGHRSLATSPEVYEELSGWMRSTGAGQPATTNR